MSDPTLVVEGLTRRFGETTAVDSLDFTLRPGVMTGFLGANGAGKTTSMRIVMGVLEPTSGRILWDGHPLTREDRTRFGYMPEERGLYPKQKILDQLVYIGRLHGLTAQRARTRATELLEAFGLAERSASRLEALSLGNQQRVQIAAALLHDPVCLVLDEPFSGLDPVAVDAMVALLGEYLRRDVPVLFSSHQLDLVERLCEDVLILHQGRLVLQGTARELREAGPTRYRAVCARDAGWLRDVPGLQVLDLALEQALVELPEGEEEALRQEVFRRGAEHGLQEFSRVRPSLGEIYREASR